MTPIEREFFIAKINELKDMDLDKDAIIETLSDIQKILYESRKR